MKANPQVFIRALRRVGLPGTYCCCPAIDPSYRHETPSPELKFFRRLYNKSGAVARWWDDDVGVRIIALQLAACVARDNAL